MKERNINPYTCEPVVGDVYEIIRDIRGFKKGEHVKYIKPYKNFLFCILIDNEDHLEDDLPRQYLKLIKRDEK